MPLPGKCWRHVILTTYGAWLPGDPRGFRTKEHKIHSSGDYRQRPPDGEHVGLLHYSKKLAGKMVVFSEEQKRTVGESLVQRLMERNHRVLVVAVASTHAHLQVELPDDDKEAKCEMGEAKRVAAISVGDAWPKHVWGKRGKFIRIETPEYQQNVYRYILNQEDAWIWSFRE